MGVVTKITKGVADQTRVNPQPNAHEAAARAMISMFDIALANGDSATSKLYLARIPSNAILIPALSTLESGGVTGLTSLSLGVDNEKGTASAALLMSAVDVSAAGSYSAVSAVTRANRVKRLWQLLGLATDPAQHFLIYATLNQAAGSAGQINGQLGWTVRGF